MHQLKLMVSTTLRFSCCSPFSLHSLKSKNSFSSSSSSSSLQYPQWSGLLNWRESPLNENRLWGPAGPEQPVQEVIEGPEALGSSLAEMGALVLSTSDPLSKSKLSHLAYSKWRQEKLPFGVFEPPTRPSRPPKPQLVSTKEIPAPKDSGLPLNAYMLHNLAHVELNAIDLAWDTVRLAELGFSYGDMPAHNLLWRECEKSSNNVSARLAVIPLVQEARGLDAGPRLVQKLIGFGDRRTSNIVAQIAEEEVAHVAVGVYWFLSVCQQMGRVPCDTFRDILQEYNVKLKGPFNYSARDEAGIPRNWYDPSSACKKDKNKQLSDVYERLSCIISMEKENSALNRPPR